MLFFIYLFIFFVTAPLQIAKQSTKYSGKRTNFLLFQLCADMFLTRTLFFDKFLLAFQFQKLYTRNFGRILSYRPRLCANSSSFKCAQLNSIPERSYVKHFIFSHTDPQGGGGRAL